MYLSLLIFVYPLLCGATDYYVRPTEPTNASCPGQPCLTLHHYIQNLSSNANYHLLPGVHSINGPITLKHVHNVSMAAFNSSVTKIAATIECNSRGNGSLHSLECSGISFQDASDITISSLSIELKLQLPSHNAYRQLSIAGMSFMNSTEVTIEGIHVWITKTRPVDDVVVIAVSQCMDVEMSSLTVKNGGIDVTQSSYVNISNYHQNGIVFYSSYGINIVHSVVSKSSHIGIYTDDLEGGINYNATVSLLQDIGISMASTEYIHIHDTIVINFSTGIYTNYLEGGIIYNARVRGSQDIGISLISVCIHDTVVMDSGIYGIQMMGANDILIRNTHVMHTGANALDIDTTRNCTIDSTELVNASAMGALIVYSRSVTLKSVIIKDWTLYAFNAYKSDTVTLNNVYIVMNKATITKQNNGLLFSECTNAMIEQSTFANFPSLKLANDVNVQPAVIVLYNNIEKNIQIVDCNFEANDVTAVKVVNSELSGSVNFTNNTAYRGAAMVFIQSGKMILSKDSHIIFKNNYAYTTGGAIYITSSFTATFRYGIDTVTANSDCFMEIEGDYSKPLLTFQNHSAGLGGDTLYGGSLGFARADPQTQENRNIRDTCLQRFMSASTIENSTLSTVSSDPSRVCVCVCDKPDCLTIFDTIQNNENRIYPGQTLVISAVVVGQNFGTVAGSVYAQFVLPSTDNSPQLAQRQGTQGVEHTRCNQLQYTIYSQPGYYTLMLTAVKLKHTYTVSKTTFAQTMSDYLTFINNENSNVYIQDMLEFPVYINIPLQPCPPGFALTHEHTVKCDCVRQLSQLPGVTCHIEDVTFYRSGLVWVGQLGNANNTDNETLGQAHVASAKYCPFNYCRNDGVRISLSRYDHQCNFNHSGTVCGGCRHGLSLALGTAQCLQCSNTYLLLFIPFAVAGPVLVAFIKALDITISHGLINGLIFYANIIKPNEHIFLPQTNTNPLTLFIAWLNLDLGVQTCFYDGLSAYGKAWLQFVFPFYVWCIAGLIIVLARYSTRFARLTGNNSVPVLATLFLLSYAKLLRTIITILSYTTVDSANGQKTVWSADENIDYLGPQHMPLFLAALATLLLLWLPYTLLLLSAHWIRKIISGCPLWPIQ